MSHPSPTNPRFSHGCHPSVVSELPQLYVLNTSKKKKACICAPQKKKCRGQNPSQDCLPNPSSQSSHPEYFSLLGDDESREGCPVKLRHAELVKRNLGREKKLPKRKVERNIHRTHFFADFFSVQTGCLFSYIHDESFANEFYRDMGGADFFKVPNERSTWFIVPFPISKNTGPLDQRPMPTPTRRQKRSSIDAIIGSAKRLIPRRFQQNQFHALNNEGSMYEDEANIVPAVSSFESMEDTHGENRGNKSQEDLTPYQARKRSRAENIFRTPPRSSAYSDPNYQYHAILNADNMISYSDSDDDAEGIDGSSGNAIKKFGTMGNLLIGKKKSVDLINSSSKDDNQQRHRSSVRGECNDNDSRTCEVYEGGEEKFTNSNTVVPLDYQQSYDGGYEDSTINNVGHLDYQHRNFRITNAAPLDDHQHIINGAAPLNDHQREFLINSAIDTLQREIVEKKDGSNTNANGLAVDILELARDKEKDVGGCRFYALNFKPAKATRRRTNMFCRLPQSNNMGSSWRKINRHNRNRAGIVETVLDVICGMGDEAKNSKRQIMQQIIEKSMNGFVHWEKLALDVEECFAVRGIGHLSASNLVRVLDAIQKLLDIEGFYPAQLKKKMSKVEWSECMGVSYVSIEAEVGQNKKKSCTFWFVTNEPLLLESLASSAVQERKFEDSIDFSNLENMTVFVGGIDRGGPDLLNCFRLVNRKDGNAGSYCVILSCFEGASETHKNLAVGTLSEERSKIYRTFKDGVHILHIILNDCKCPTSSALPDTLPDLQPFARLNNEGSELDARCIAVQFKATPAFCVKKLRVEVSVSEHIQELEDIAKLKDFYSKSRYADEENRTSPDEINVSGLIANNSLDLVVQLVLANARDIELEKLPIGSSLPKYVRNIPFDQRSVVGVNVLSSEGAGKHLYSFRFKSSMPFKNGVQQVSLCQRAYLYSSNDGKMTTSLTGIGTAGATYNCTKCIKRKDDRALPAWCEKYRDILGPDFVCRDAPLRTEGTYRGVEECQKRHMDILGKHNEYSGAADERGTLDKHAIDECFSVRNKVLQVDPPADQHGDALHLAAGMLTHQNTEIYEQLGLVETDNNSCPTALEKEKRISWVEQKVKEAIDVIEPLTRIKQTIQYKEAMKKCSRALKEQKELQKKLRKAIDEGQCEEITEMLEKHLNNATKVVAKMFKTTGAGVMNMKYKGACKFLKLITNKTKKKKTKKKKTKKDETNRIPVSDEIASVQNAKTKKKTDETNSKSDSNEDDSSMKLDAETKEMKRMVQKGLEKPNEAQYVFKTAIRTQAGEFNKQHGQIELTCTRGILCLERRQAVYNIASKAYEGTNPDANEKVKTIMDWWLKLSDHLYVISKLMKSQEKMTKDRCLKLEKELMYYVRTWYDFFKACGIKKSPLYPKLHAVLCQFVAFCWVHGMGGKVSTEGFENVHFWLNRLRRMMSPIVQTNVRVNKISQRQSLFLLPAIAKKMNLIKERTTKGGRRGKYNVKARSTRAEQDIEEYDLTTEDSEEVPEGFYLTEEGDLLPLEVQELEAFNMTRKVPKHFLRHFENSNDIGSKAKLEARNYT